MEVIKTERLLLRKPQPSDYEDLYIIHVIIQQQDQKLVGMTGLQYKTIDNQVYLNLYYLINPSKTRQGYVKEAAQAIIEAVRNALISAPPIVALTSYDNLPSRKTAEALGLKHQQQFDDLGRSGNVYYFSEVQV